MIKKKRNKYKLQEETNYLKYVEIQFFQESYHFLEKFYVLSVNATQINLKSVRTNTKNFMYYKFLPTALF